MKGAVFQSQPRTLDFFFLSGNVSNEYFSSYIKSKIDVRPKLILIGAYALNRLLPDGDKYLVPLPVRPTDLTVFDGSAPNVDFTDEEKARGERILNQIGVLRNDRIVCFYIRDEAYGKQFFTSVDQSYTDYRNSTLENYIDAMTYFTENGYTVFRMGKTVKSTLDFQSSKIIDYSNSPVRSDFMDFYIASRMEMAISTDSGMMLFPIWARKPFGLVNVPASHGIIESQYLLLFQFKIFFSRKFNRVLSLNEVINTTLLDSDSSLDFQRKGLTHIENTKEDILDFSKELLALFKHKNTHSELASEHILRLVSSLGGDYQSWIPKKISLNWLETNRKLLF